MGETRRKPSRRFFAYAFSILERIDVGETSYGLASFLLSMTFSILERIDVGETDGRGFWVSLLLAFQYPRTDRRG